MITKVRQNWPGSKTKRKLVCQRDGVRSSGVAGPQDDPQGPPSLTFILLCGPLPHCTRVDLHFPYNIADMMVYLS